MPDPDILETHYDPDRDAWAIFNAAGERLALTKIGPAQVANEGKGKTFSDKLRWVIETGQVLRG